MISTARDAAAAAAAAAAATASSRPHGSVPLAPDEPRVAQVDGPEPAAHALSARDGPVVDEAEQPALAGATRTEGGLTPPCAVEADDGSRPTAQQQQPQHQQRCCIIV